MSVGQACPADSPIAERSDYLPGGRRRSLLGVRRGRNVNARDGGIARRPPMAAQWLTRFARWPDYTIFRCADMRQVGTGARHHEQLERRPDVFLDCHSDRRSSAGTNTQWIAAILASDHARLSRIGQCRRCARCRRPRGQQFADAVHAAAFRVRLRFRLGLRLPRGLLPEVIESRSASLVSGLADGLR